MSVRPVLAVLSVVAGLAAGAVTGVTPVDAQLSAPDWAVDPAQSKVAITGKEAGKTFSGTVEKWQGMIFFDPKSLDSSHVSITVDVGSIRTGDTGRDSLLPSTQWLAAKVFPMATFEADRFNALGNNNYEALGFLTIRGVRRSVSLPFTVDMDGNVARARGTLSLLRSDFGVGEGVMGAEPGYAVEVGVTFDITAKH